MNPGGVIQPQVSRQLGEVAYRPGLLIGVAEAAGDPIHQSRSVTLTPSHLCLKENGDLSEGINALIVILDQTHAESLQFDC